MNNLNKKVLKETYQKHFKIKIIITEILQKDAQVLIFKNEIDILKFKNMKPISILLTIIKLFEL